MGTRAGTRGGHALREMHERWQFIWGDQWGAFLFFGRYWEGGLYLDRRAVQGHVRLVDDAVAGVLVVVVVVVVAAIRCDGVAVAVRRRDPSVMWHAGVPGHMTRVPRAATAQGDWGSAGFATAFSSFTFCSTGDLQRKKTNDKKQILKGESVSISGGVGNKTEGDSDLLVFFHSGKNEIAKFTFPWEI